MHRCRIPECEPIHSPDFNTNWLKFAVPFNNGQPARCERFQYIPKIGGDADANACSEQNFNSSQIVQCDEILVKNNEQRLLSRVSLPPLNIGHYT